MSKCGPALLGVDALFSSPEAILVGEGHGTTEIPAFIGRLACEAQARGLTVGVGFESYGEQGGAFDRYLQSDGSDAARSALLKAKHFEPDPDVADGRGSVAMADLFETLRRQREAGGSVFVFTVGPVEGERASGARDEWMAQRVVEARETHPDAALIVLAGGHHTAVRTAEEQPGVGTSMAWYLVNRHQLPVVSLAWWKGGGTIWNPVDPGHVRTVPGKDLGRTPFIETVTDVPGVDAAFYLGPTTPSPPARYPDALTTAQ